MDLKQIMSENGVLKNKKAATSPSEKMLQHKSTPGVKFLTGQPSRCVRQNGGHHLCKNKYQ